jgi:hypothetical protein
MLASAESTGYVRGATTWAFPTARTCPQVIINSTNNFKSLIGFKAGTYPAASSNTFQTFLSTTTPTLSPVSSLVLTCSLCQQDLSTPDNLLFCFTAGQTIFGDTIAMSPSALSFCNIREGSYNFIDLTLVDQNLNAMNIKDGQMIIMLTIRDLANDGAYGKN